MVVSIVSCNCDEGARLFLPALVLLDALAYSAVSHSSNSFLCLFFVLLKLLANFLSVFYHIVSDFPEPSIYLLVFLFVVGKILPETLLLVSLAIFCLKF